MAALWRWDKSMLRILLIGFALIWSIGVQSQDISPPKGEVSQAQNYPKTPSYKATKNGNVTLQSPVFVKILPDQKSEIESIEAAKEQKEKENLDRKLVFFNGDLAYYTKLLAWLAGFQFLALVAQATFLRLAFRESKRAGDIAREAMVAGERAFVFPKSFLQFWELDPETGLYNWRFRPNWENSGDTPTKNMTHHAECILTDEPLPTGFNFDYTAEIIGVGLIPPKTTLAAGMVPLPPKPAITTQDLLDMQGGKKYLYMMGWVKYFDVFPDTPEHITRFCWGIIVTGNPKDFVPKSTEDGETLLFNNLYNSEGNCADDECKHPQLGD